MDSQFNSVLITQFDKLSIDVKTAIVLILIRLKKSSCSERDLEIVKFKKFAQGLKFLVDHKLITTKSQTYQREFFPSQSLDLSNETGSNHIINRYYGTPE